MVFISMTSPSSRGLGQQPLTLRTGVQIPLGTPPSPQHIVPLCSHLPHRFSDPQRVWPIGSIECSRANGVRSMERPHKRIRGTSTLLIPRIVDSMS